MKIKKIYLLILFITSIILLISFSLNTTITKANELSDNMNNQLENIDLGQLEDFLNSIQDKPAEFDFVNNIYLMLNGEYTFSYDDLFTYIIDVFIIDLTDVMPILLGIIAIAILSGILNNLKSNFLRKGTGDLIFFVCFLGVILLLGTQLISFYIKTKNLIETLSKLNQIMSPIILTLMVASGGSVSASVYKPAVSFLSGGIINIFLSVVLPLVAISAIFTVVSNFSQTVKLNKLSDCASSVVKWIIGLSVTSFGLFLTVQGITSASFDGISIRATKYAISNSVPIIGGFLKDGFDLVVAGSVLIKNAIGVISVFALFYIVLSPVLLMAVYSILLKFVAGIIEPFSDSRIGGLCSCASKMLTYFTVAILMVGLMLFITILLMIFSANALI